VDGGETVSIHDKLVTGNLVVVYDFNWIGVVFICPNKTNSPLIINTDATLTLVAAHHFSNQFPGGTCKSLETVTWFYVSQPFAG
jgi:hypothetical protein